MISSFIFLKSKLLICEFMRLEHKSLTEVLWSALRARYCTLIRSGANQHTHSDAALKKIRQLPVIDRRSADNAIYDEFGLPR